MAEAVARHATYARGSDRALLGRFVLPTARLDECAAAVDALPPALAPTGGAPWRLSVLAAVDDAPTLAAFNARERRRLVIDTVETRADAVAAMTAIAAALDGYTTYVEIPVREDPTPLVAALGAHGLRAKVRTGGVTADAFPSPAEVLRFLDACVRGGVPFKATAGLHHPLRGEYALTYAADAPRGTMYGFLNIFLAAAFLEAGLAPNQVAPLLEERDASAIVVRPESIGGTPANRLVHRESGQLFIGPYVIDAARNVRTIPYTALFGRPTGVARHLTDPAREVLVATMEEGVYAVDVEDRG